MSKERRQDQQRQHSSAHTRSQKKVHGRREKTGEAGRLVIKVDGWRHFIFRGHLFRDAIVLVRG